MDQKCILNKIYTKNVLLFFPFFILNMIIDSLHLKLQA